MTKVKFTNRSLERGTEWSHPQIKRYANAFLHSKARAGQSTGKESVYGFDAALKIYVGGYLVNYLNFSIEAAQRILNDIFAWLKREHWPPRKYVQLERGRSGRVVPKVAFPNLRIDIGTDRKGRHFYHALEILGPPIQDENADDVFHQSYRKYKTFGSDMPQNYSGIYRDLPLGTLVDTLARHGWEPK